MTQNELLAAYYNKSKSMQKSAKNAKALATIMALHRSVATTFPDGKNGESCNECYEMTFPCKTRLAIMEAMA